MPSKFKTEVAIDKKRIKDLFINACEGGSNYWCKSIKPHGKGDAYDAMFGGFTVDGIIEMSYTKKVVTTAMVERAIKDFATKEPRAFADFISENDDANTADTFLQLCVFGKTIFG